jgi:hypothetical protein
VKRSGKGVWEINKKSKSNETENMLQVREKKGEP